MKVKGSYEEVDTWLFQYRLAAQIQHLIQQKMSKSVEMDIPMNIEHRDTSVGSN